MMSQFPRSQPLKKAEGKILIRAFRLGRPNLLMLLPSGPIYKCKIAYVPLLPTILGNSFLTRLQAQGLLVCVRYVQTAVTNLFLSTIRKKIGIELNRTDWIQKNKKNTVTYVNMFYLYRILLIKIEERYTCREIICRYSFASK